jgi:AraC-like DNA-binding protein
MPHPPSHSSLRPAARQRRRLRPGRRSVAESPGPGLAGPCDGPPGDRLRLLPGAPGLERLEARLHGRAYAPHRHDTYTIGLTLAGVQSFRFRGRQWHSLPGQAQILHPDELHDGVAGTAEPFAYRALYLDPGLLQQALAGRPLPFVGDPVVAPASLPPDLVAAIWGADLVLDALGQSDLVTTAAELLRRASGGAQPAGRLALAGLERVRERLVAQPADSPAMPELEALSGLDRWSLARQFRAAFGTSPSRFRTLRRLDLARQLLRQGSRPAEAAAAAGFADQSHLTRQFKQAYGLTPARWAAALVA